MFQMFQSLLYPRSLMHSFATRYGNLGQVAIFEAIERVEALLIEEQM